jgi:hypothetical protein
MKRYTLHAMLQLVSITKTQNQQFVFYNRKTIQLVDF